MRGFVVLMLVIGPFLIDYEHDYHPSPRLRLGRRAGAGVKQRPKRPTLINRERAAQR
jgi:hypothetical protein